MPAQKSAKETQIENMVNFIKQEAQDKAIEIESKNRAELGALKNTQQKKRTDELKDKFAKKIAEAEVERRITKSRQLTESKISVLRNRDVKLSHIQKEVTERLLATSQDSKYPQLIQTLLIEGLLRVQEKKVVVQCRQMDLTIVQAAIPVALEAFSKLVKEKTGIDYKTTITLADTFLPGPPREGYEGCCGGVILSARGGTIVLRNTLDARLELAFYELKPAIRGILFGERAKIESKSVERQKLNVHS